MKIEKLSKGRFKNIVIIVLIISIIEVVTINKSKAKYRVTQSIQVVSGEVNYKVPDLNVLALYKQKTEGNTDDNNYESITDVPTGKYVVNADKSYCTIIGNDTQLKNKMTYSNGEISININKKGTKCYVYLDIQATMSGADLLAEIKTNSTSEGCPTYGDNSSITSIADKENLFCIGKDDFGDTYYYRGKVENNWVKLGNFYWRIIRFNGNGSIRLIYSGNGSATTSGTGTQTKMLSFNYPYNSEKYVKYMYDDYATSSTIKQELDSWYTTNLKSSYGSKMDGTVGFCNDADYGPNNGSVQFFKPYTRIVTNKTPTFKCGTPTTNLYTISGGTKGNQKLTDPIGLITVDEASFAGGVWEINNPDYYLFTGQDYWTMSPHGYGTANMFYVDSNGSFDYTYAGKAQGVRPVINLKADTLFKGEGTSSNPYEVVI